MALKPGDPPNRMRNRKRRLQVPKKRRRVTPPSDRRMYTRRTPNGPYSYESGSRPPRA